jgi:Fe2+ or Zn2+ uptake regulation protein
MILIIITDMDGKASRWTRQLKVIVNIIYESDRPLNADEIFSKARRDLPRISLGTVYRNLKKLQSEGLISEFMDGGVATFHRHPFPNAHFQCERCNKLVSVPVELSISDLSRMSGMTVNRWSLRLAGVCSECERCT